VTVATDRPDPPADDPASREAQAPAPRGRQRRPDVWQLFDQLQKPEPERQKLLTNAVGIKLALIPAGTFLMGSPEEEPGHRVNEGPQHEVAVTSPFYAGIHLVTQEQYERVMGRSPAHFSRAGGGGPDHPVDNVSWDDAVAFCRKLSELPAEKQAGRAYRLPTEAEWEYACRAGTDTPFCYGASLSAVQANFDGGFPYGGDKGRSPQKTTRVGTYPANHFGLYDVHGNIWEWCADWYNDAYYRHSPRRDPQGPPTGQFRVVRGGCWRNHAATCRAAYRNGLVPHNRDMFTGFRVVAAVPAAPV
jgi:formylglycine-generating enzyme required for sulfatase activity